MVITLLLALAFCWAAGGNSESCLSCNNSLTISSDHQYINASVILPYNKSLASWSRVKTAFCIASHEVENLGILSTYKLCFTYRNSNCSNVHGLKEAIEAYKNGKLNVLFGPTCEFSLGKLFLLCHCLQFFFFYTCYDYDSDISCITFCMFGNILSNIKQYVNVTECVVRQLFSLNKQYYVNIKVLSEMNKRNQNRRKLQYCYRPYKNVILTEK